MSETSVVDFGKTASDYAKYRVGFPEWFFQTLKQKGYAEKGFTALDVGTGTGTIARGLAKLSCITTGLDPSESLLMQAKNLDGAAGLSIEYIIGTAEHIPVGDREYDLVTAGQCWHWFDANKAAKDIRRVLKPSGHLVIAYFDWVASDGNVVDATERLIEKHNPSWTRAIKPSFFRRSPPHIDTPETFDLVDTFRHDLLVPYSHEAWRGRIRASAPIGASMSSDRVNAFDVEHERILRKNFPQDPLDVPHRVWAMVLKPRFSSVGTAE